MFVCNPISQLHFFVVRNFVYWIKFNWLEAYYCTLNKPKYSHFHLVCVYRKNANLCQRLIFRWWLDHKILVRVLSLYRTPPISTLLLVPTELRHSLVRQTTSMPVLSKNSRHFKEPITPQVQIFSLNIEYESYQEEVEAQSTILSLPDEMLREIFSNLTEDERAPLGMVYRRFRSVDFDLAGKTFDCMHVNLVSSFMFFLKIYLHRNLAEQTYSITE